MPLFFKRKDKIRERQLGERKIIKYVIFSFLFSCGDGKKCDPHQHLLSLNGGKK